MSEEWYKPGAIRFTRRQALWLVQTLGCLREGRWPPDVNHYIDVTGKRSGRSGAYFTLPIEYAAEIETRLEKCDIDGLILEAVECWGKTEASMSKYLRIPEWSVRKRMKKALGYVSSGPDRRWHTTKKRKGQTYQEFASRRKKWQREK